MSREGIGVSPLPSKERGRRHSPPEKEKEGKHGFSSQSAQKEKRSRENSIKPVSWKEGKEKKGALLRNSQKQEREEDGSLRYREKKCPGSGFDEKKRRFDRQEAKKRRDLY